ncbi:MULTISPECIES: macrolide ABC transporter ATP-binding protein/permease MacB [Xenorhabdus]|uniref:macrolide ABC transporter ATP-binding protein/permease MacB n=1 Tax=Xenorhabdus TaxID=626 RepID=UPI00064980EE|nr:MULTISPECIES: macrolide ABC transporter ATP-binding protein/permease MacB [Xenorhabdus]KLU16602.1 macrolide transporter [Xenorhabdus griffiniae]KOP32601.1 macrolide transporter [Xenorhabdus sp. GDc328]
MDTLLELKGVSRNYPAGEGQLTVLDNISLSIQAGEMVAIVGASGSGKSTLMNILGCLDKPSSGEYWVAGRNIADLDSDQLAELRREYFGFIFQRYHLLTHLTAEQNVEIPAIYSGVSKIQRRERAIELLKSLGLENRIDYRPSQLSGGQQQRVSIARALMNGGQVILADEPTGALDSTSGQEMMDILKKLCQRGHTVVIVTHDPNIAAQVQRVIEIKDGRIMSEVRSSERPKLPLPSSVETKTVNVKTSSVQQIWGRFNEALLMAWRAMNVNKLRTLLTMLGIIIGIASVVTIVVIGDAAKSMVLSHIKSIATNSISIYPGKDFGSDNALDMQALKLTDIPAIKSQPYVQAVSPEFMNEGRLRQGNMDAKAQISGVGSDFFQVYAMKFSQGIPFTSDMIERQSQVVIIDDNTRKKFFPYQGNVVGKELLLINMPLTVIGVIANGQSLYSSNTLQVWVPYSTMNSRLMNQNYLNSIAVRLKDDHASNEAEEKINQLLIFRHGKKDFHTYNMNKTIKIMDKTTRTMQIFLTLVAVISLVVGGIGVMNIMLVSVTERTREIGIRMAVGARTSDIMQQFLIEAVLVCLIGGILGIILSCSISFMVQLMLPNWDFVYNFTAFIIAFGCSTAIGIIFGFLPAKNAAHLDPIEALARE